MSNIISIQELEIPYKITPLSGETVEGYFDEMKDFFHNIGFYSYGERQTYNSLLVDYYSDVENGEPCFCFCQLVKNKYVLFGICPCLYNKSNNTYYPFTISGISENYALAICQYKSIIVFSTGQSETNNSKYYGLYPKVKYIYLNDGRKIFFFISQYEGDPAVSPTSLGYKLFNFGGCLYFTNIKCRDQNISNNKKCIIFSDSPNTSYFQEIDSTASLVNDLLVHGEYRYNFMNPRTLLTCGGYIPNMGMRKDFLLKLPCFYIGDEYYIEEITFFSDGNGLRNGGSSVGDIINIDNKEYIILYNQPSAAMNNVVDTRSSYFKQDPKGSTSISLIIPTDDLED